MKKLVWQNMTEGPVTFELKEADIVLASETSFWRLRRGRGLRRCGQYRNRKADGLAINWKRSEFKVVTKGAIRFHRSGKAEGWAKIKSPARGLIFVIGYWKDDPARSLYCYWVTHFLNSWFPAGKRDQWTDMRGSIVRQRSIPLIEEFIFQTKRDLPKVKGGLGGGDTNSIPWNGSIHGLTHIFNRGLDRVWAFGDVDAAFFDHTPRTGVGNQMRHEGIRVKQNV